MALTQTRSFFALSRRPGALLWLFLPLLPAALAAAEAPAEALPGPSFVREITTIVHIVQKSSEEERERGLPEFVYTPIRFTRERPAVRFVFRAPGAREVFVSASFDRWQGKIPLQRTNGATWVGYCTNELAEGRYYYKYLVDGIWTHDTCSSNIAPESGGGLRSYFDLTNNLYDFSRSPRRSAGDLYRFYRLAREGETLVSLVGSFNKWDPLRNVMERNPYGYWETEIQIPPGEHTYLFVVDGIWILDARSVETRINRNGIIASYLDAGPSRAGDDND